MPLLYPGCGRWRLLLSGGGSRVRSGLVVGQMALAMMLLAGAGLLIRSFVQLQQVKPGFEVGSALTFRIALPSAEYKDEDRRVSFYQRLTERLSALPGAQSVGAIAGLPLTDRTLNISFTVKDRPAPPPKWFWREAGIRRLLSSIPALFRPTHGQSFSARTEAR